MLVTADRVFGGHLYVRNGKIAAISDDGTLPAREELDAAGLYVLPGMLDCHAHINDPGFTWREDLPHASEAAAVGGVTTLIDMPLQNTPPLTSADAFANKLAVFEGRSLVDYALWGGLVTDNAAELAGMEAAGAVGFKAFIAPVSLGYSSVDMGLAREALFRIKAFGGLAGFHCEDHALICAGEAKAKAGGGTRRAFLDSRPVVAEVIATANVIELARETGARVHICHVSHPRVAELVRRAQADGLSVTGETCPHYLVFTEENLLSCGTVFKCAPPLRTAEARDGLWEYVLDGTLSCIGSDHSPRVGRPQRSPEPRAGHVRSGRDPARVQPEPAGPVRLLRREGVRPRRPQGRARRRARRGRRPDRSGQGLDDHRSFPAVSQSVLGLRRA